MRTERVEFVAEVSSNHAQDLQHCLNFIRSAAAIGCNAVKFQLFKLEHLFAPEILSKSREHLKRKSWELPEEFLPELAAFSREKAVQFSCTPFYLDAVGKLFPHVDFYKIASYELLWDELLMLCAQTGKPVVLSTGMATMKEIVHATEVLRRNGCHDLTLLHCVSSYPTPVDECHLAAMEILQKSLGCPVGWSDHSVVPAVIHRAVHRWGASMIEFHLDLDGKGAEYFSGHCWLPEQIEQVISDVRQGLIADGEGVKQPAPSEKSDRMWRADPSDGLRPLKTIRNHWDG